MFLINIYIRLTFQKRMETSLNPFIPQPLDVSIPKDTHHYFNSFKNWNYILVGMVKCDLMVVV